MKSKTLNKKVIFLVALSGLIIITVTLFFFYTNSLKTLVINFNDNIEVEIFKEPTKDGEDKKLIKQINSPAKIKLKKGSYIVTSKENGDYYSSSNAVTIENTSTQIDIIPDYTEKKLDSLLGQESNDLSEIISKKYPGYQANYTIKKSRLFGRGNWAGILFSPNNPSELDTLRLILKKENNKWETATNPEIIIGTPQYPEIPPIFVNYVDNYL